ncbi:membrane-associated progesterone receptor component 1 [Elysia marginata]|uniref:Membrane-associated progesterone receptor component 1 n=1 Tax=Elysia marginata TaxID=1093978 RepID=A0AAV4HT50_9GAST|nr:membrane-associated progesterone receptor component 1 [Elysia marginata]
MLGDSVQTTTHTHTVMTKANKGEFPIMRFSITVAQLGSHLIFFTFLLLLRFSTSDASQESYTLKEVIIEKTDGEHVNIYTAEDLKKYDGSAENEAILMGIKGVVFDVSKGKRFYGKDSPYNALVGKDSTRAVAKMSLDPSDLTHDISGLPPSTLRDLDDVFEGTYMAKYPVVGYMDYLLEQRPDLFDSVSPKLRNEL